MARHLGFSFANTGACAQAQVHHSLLVSRHGIYYDAAGQSLRAHIGSQCTQTRDVNSYKYNYVFKMHFIASKKHLLLVTFVLQI